MAIQRIQIIPEGYTDIVHPETDSAMVIMDNGKTLSKAIEDGEIGGSGGITLDSKYANREGVAVVTSDIEACSGKSLKFSSSSTESIFGIRFTNNKVPFGINTATIRIKTDNIKDSNIIQLGIVKKCVGKDDQIISCLDIKGSDFSLVNKYKTFNTTFLYDGSKSVDETLSIFVAAFSSSDAVTIDLDYIFIQQMAYSTLPIYSNVPQQVPIGFMWIQK